MHFQILLISIQISVNTNESGLLKIEVYDLSGRFVEKIYEEYSSNEFFQLNWSPNGISSGSYIIKMSQNNKINQLLVTYEK